MIIVDWMGHLVSTEGSKELHRFAKKMGLKREWYQRPGPGENHSHYDLTTGKMLRKSWKLGARLVDPKEIIKKAWWAKWSAGEWQEISSKG